MTLCDIETGGWATISGFEGGDKLSAKIRQHGLFPGDLARVIRRAPLGGPLLIEVDGREIVLGRGVAAKILVEVG